MNRKIFIRAVLAAAFFMMSAMPVMADEAPAEIVKIAEVAAEDGSAVSEEGILGSYQETEEKIQIREDQEEAAQLQAQAQANRTWTDEDLYILAHVICGEAQGCSDEEQRYVGSVVLNRVNHGAFPNTIKDVVFQKGQYACTRDGNYYREPTAANWANARWLLENGSVLPGNVVYQARGAQGAVHMRTQWHTYCYA